MLKKAEKRDLELCFFVTDSAMKYYFESLKPYLGSDQLVHSWTECTYLEALPHIVECYCPRICILASSSSIFVPKSIY